jgi:amino acid adenylation domain-containing protein
VSGTPLWVPVRNGAGHCSVWPADRPLPVGWAGCGPRAEADAALNLVAAAGNVPVAVSMFGVPRIGAGLPPRPEGGFGFGLGRGALPAHRRFATLARRHPRRAALIEGDTEVPYGKLSGRAAQVRAGLLRRGVGPGSTVGLCLDRGADLAAALLGVLATGAAYLPLDGRYPAARLEFMVADGEVACVVADHRYAAALSRVSAPVLTVPELTAAGTREKAPRAPEPDDVAYVRYTSGSTGRPKGVAVTHRNLGCLLDAMVALLPAGATDRVLWSARPATGMAALELLLPLTTGGACVVGPDTGVVNARAVTRLAAATRPTLVQATPAGWRLLLDAGIELDRDQVALCGGDPLPAPLAGRLATLPGPAYNLYGLTEASTWATAWRIGAGRQVLVGSALAHARVHVLGPDLRLVPPGTPGEAYVGGPAVAAGYLGRPRLTAERFVPDPWSPVPGGRLYATGDLVRWEAGGLRFIRRLDASATATTEATNPPAAVTR